MQIDRQIYIYRERDRDRERKRERKNERDREREKEKNSICCRIKFGKNVETNSKDIQ